MTWVNGKQNLGAVNSRNRVDLLYKSVPFTENWQRRRESGIKVGFKEMEHQFPFGTFRPEKQDLLLRSSVALGDFPLERLKKLCYIYYNFQPNFQETFCKW